jgi:hypothetical protein
MAGVPRRSWGLIEQERLSKRDLELLDHLAQATRSDDAAFDELRRLYPSREAPGAQCREPDGGGQRKGGMSGVALGRAGRRGGRP